MVPLSVDSRRLSGSPADGSVIRAAVKEVMELCVNFEGFDRNIQENKPER